MKLTLEEMDRINKEFKSYSFKSPYFPYLTACGRVIGLQNLTGGDSTSDSLRDCCLFLGFRELPPKEIMASVPDEYQGVRVVHQVIGRARF